MYGEDEESKSLLGQPSAKMLGVTEEAKIKVWKPTYNCRTDTSDQSEGNT